MNLRPYQDPDVIRRILGRKVIAIVGLSSNSLRASNFVGRYLLRHDYKVIPVNPREEEILGQKSYASLKDIPVDVGTVDVFRHPDATPDIAREAVAIGSQSIWFQYGVINEESIQIAKSGGLDVVVDCCMKVEYARYFGRMHWLGFNTGRITAQRASVD